MAILLEIKKKMPEMLLDVSYEGLADKVGILGGSGSGKSCLLKCIAGVEKPDRGKIQFDGKVIFDSEKKLFLKAKNRKIGYIPSDFALFPNMSVEENIRCGYQGKRSSAEAVVEFYVQKYELAGLEDEHPLHLTDLAKLRTALARAMIGEPEMLLFDDLFLGKAGYQRASLFSDFRRYLRAYDGKYLFASDNPEEICSLCDSVIVLGTDGVLASGKTEEIFRKPLFFEVARLTGCRNYSKIEKLDDYHVQALDWGIMLRTEEPVTEKIHFVGIRDYDIRRAEGSLVNCMPIRVIESVRNMGFWEYEVCYPGEEQKGKSIYWKTDEESQIPGYLYFPPERLLLLQ